MGIPHQAGLTGHLPGLLLRLGTVNANEFVNMLVVSVEIDNDRAPLPLHTGILGPDHEKVPRGVTLFRLADHLKGPGCALADGAFVLADVVDGVLDQGHHGPVAAPGHDAAFTPVVHLHQAGGAALPPSLHKGCSHTRLLDEAGGHSDAAQARCSERVLQGELRSFPARKDIAHISRTAAVLVRALAARVAASEDGAALKHVATVASHRLVNQVGRIAVGLSTLLQRVAQTHPLAVGAGLTDVCQSPSIWNGGSRYCSRLAVTATQHGNSTCPTQHHHSRHVKACHLDSSSLMIGFQ
mmetsp:Transcript_37409/g.82044  ORF Transcript_37409/g.82044 Transcript_37409/m.82044 type:complete len:297 (-) Transcript_37409:76-966(-)